MKKAFILLITTLLLTSCEAIIEKAMDTATGTPKYAIGNPYEVLVVCDDGIWESELGQAVRKSLAQEVPGLPQAENAFVFTRVTVEEFTGLKKLFRNILLVKADENFFTSPSFSFARDINAESQIIMTIQAPTVESGADYVNKNLKVILDFFNNVEMERKLKSLEQNYNYQANKIVEDLFGCSLKIPMNINGKLVGKDFVWFSDMNSSNPVIKSFAIYSFPYTDVKDLSVERFVQMRDSMMMENIQGGKEGQYVKTDVSNMFAVETSLNERYVLEVRGLWEMTNEFMGGPFVSHSVVDEVNQRVIVVEAFVHASNKRKADIMRELEASLHTLKLPVDFILEQTESAQEIVVEDKKDTNTK